MPVNQNNCHVLHVGATNETDNYSYPALPKKGTHDVPQEFCAIHSYREKEAKELCAMHSYWEKGAKFLACIKRFFLFCYLSNRMVLALYRACIGKTAAGVRWQVLIPDKKKNLSYQLVPSFRHEGNQRTLVDLRLFTLEQRRLQGMVTETFKILWGFSGLYPASVLELSVNRTWYHDYKLVPPRFNIVLYSDFPTFKVSILLNSMPEAVINGPSVDAFKRR